MLIQNILVASLVLIGLLLGVTRLRYSKVINSGKFVVGNLYVSFDVLEQGYGFSFLGFGKLYSLSVDLPLHANELYIDGYKKEKTIFDAPLYFQQDQKLILEGDFNRYFDVYTCANKQIETLQILTPDIMEYLRDNFSKFDIHNYRQKSYDSKCKNKRS